jgi:hypothetical protein
MRESAGDSRIPAILVKLQRDAGIGGSSDVAVRDAVVGRTRAFARRPHSAPSGIEILPQSDHQKRSLMPR